MIRTIRDLFTYHLRSTREFAAHDVENVYRKAMRDLSAAGVQSLHGKRVLDLGCGQRFPFSLMAVASGAQVVALDMSYVKPEVLPAYFLHALSANGLNRAARSAVRRLFFDRKYYGQLETSFGAPLLKGARSIDFILADPQASKYPLTDCSFDLIASNAVLEHVQDVGMFFSEIRRLLKTGGVFYGIIHNYFSLSGGHNLLWAYPDQSPTTDVPPWDHLRKNRFPSHVYLNRLLPEEFRKIAASHLQVLTFEGRNLVHDRCGAEGERYLTPEIQSELSRYDRETLLTRSYCIICKKES